MAREFAVTSLRSIFLEHKLEFQTSEIAKYKTNVQMGGAAIIFLTYIFKNTGADRYILAAICVAACVAVLVYYAVTRSVGLRAFSVAFMLTIAFTGRMIFSPPRFIQVCFAIVLFFTLVSGIQYALRGWHERPRKSLKLKARHWHLLLFYPVVLSGIFVGTLCYTKLMTWAVILIFALEFAGRGLDNHVTYCGRMLPLPTELVKSALQIVGGLCALGAGYLKFHDSPVVFALSLVFVVILTSTYNILIFYRNRDLLL
jgi:phosphatidylglycerophosphate synthase